MAIKKAASAAFFMTALNITSESRILGEKNARN
jgi:hypothetical protein